MPDTYADVLRYSDEATPELFNTPKNINPLQEIGTTGLKRATGVIDEEFLPALRGRKAVKVYREMSLNDPMVGAMLFAIDKLCRQVTWRVEGPDNTEESAQAVEFVEQCMDDMSHTWNDMISEILSMLVYGWSWHEIVYKKRVGPWEKDGSKRSKYTDGKIGWRKIPIRSQETMLRWLFDPDGGVQGLVQLAPPTYATSVIPIDKSLLFRTGLHKGNPEGVSMLRNAYRPWFFKKRLEEFEAIGVERDLAGMPVASVPSTYMNAKPGSREASMFGAFKKMVQNVRRDEHEGLVLPLEYDEKGNELFKFELMSSGGARTFDTNALISRYEQRILMTALADFILLGHEQTGSYAMHVDKTGIFKAALNVITEAIADVFNRHAIPRLFALNAWKPEELPRIVPANVDPPNLTELGGFMTQMAGMGMQFFPDPDLEKFLRDVAQLPEIPDDQLEQRRQMAMMQNASAMMQTQMETHGMAQQTSMVQQGMSPEQAAMQQQTPTDEQAQQQAGQAQLASAPNPQQQQAEMDSKAADEQGKENQRQHELKTRALDMQAKEHDLKIRQKSSQLDLQAKERDTKRDQGAKDRDLKRSEALANLKHKMATNQEKARAKAAQETARNAKLRKTDKPKPKGR